MSKTINPPGIREIVFTCLFTGLIIVGAQIAISPGISPVPITMQTLFVLMAGFLLGPAWGTASVGLFILIGLVGFPVFSKGGSGFQALFGPTGGFLFGFLAAAWIAGMFTFRRKGHPVLSLLGMIAASAAIYLIGVPWLKIKYAMSWDKALAAGLFPFLVGDVIKLAMALALGTILRPVLGSFLKKDQYGYSSDKATGA